MFGRPRSGNCRKRTSFRIQKNTTMKILVPVAAPILAIVSFTALAPGQANPPFSGLLPSTTFPSDHAPNLVAKKLTNGAYSNYRFPFAWGKARQMALYESHDLKIPHGKTVTHVGFQAEPGRNSTGVKLQLRVQMGRSIKTVKTVSSTFNANFSGAPTTVFGGTGGALFDLPDLGNTLTPGKDRPFVFVPTQAYVHDASKNMLVDYHVVANAAANKAFYYYLDQAGYVSTVRSIGTGCKDSSGNIPRLASSRTPVGGTWRLNLTNAPRNNRMGFSISLGKAATPWTWLGRPDCKIYVDVLAAPNFLILGQTSSSGSARLTIPVPDVPSVFNDLKIYSQATVHDFFAASQTSLSNGDEIELGMNPQMALLAQQGDPGTAKTGYVYRNAGVVSHFRHN